MKRTFLKVVAIAFVGANVALAAAAMPKFIGDRIVDRIMNWGDKHIGGPFKKGGGDEAVTREVVSDVVMPINAWRAVLNLTVGQQSSTATPEQDTPGWTPQGAPLPAPQGQIAADGQPAPSGQPVPSTQAPTAQQPIPVPTTQVSSAPERTHDSPVGPSDHVAGGATPDAPAGNNSAALHLKRRTRLFSCVLANTPGRKQLQTQTSIRIPN